MPPVPNPYRRAARALARVGLHVGDGSNITSPVQLAEFVEVAALNRGRSARRRKRRVRLSQTAHAPPGGVTIAGQFFRGGQFVPDEVVAQATPEERSYLDIRGPGDGPAGGRAAKARPAGVAHRAPSPAPDVKEVTFGDAAREEAAKVFGGTAPDHARLAAACNAVDGATVRVEKVAAGVAGIKVTVLNPGGGQAIRAFYRTPDGTVMAKNLWFKNPADSGKRGYEILLDQVRSLRDMGVTHITTDAARADYPEPMVGYAVWPKLGYEGKLTDAQFARLPEPVRRAMGEKKGFLGLFGNVPGSRSVRKLYDEVPGGAKAWEEVGDTVYDMTFDLADDSPNMQALERYAAERASRGPKE